MRIKLNEKYFFKNSLIYNYISIYILYNSVIIMIFIIINIMKKSLFNYF